MKKTSNPSARCLSICMADVDYEGDRKKRLAKGKWGTWSITKDRKYFTTDRPRYLYIIKLSELKKDGPLHWFAHLRSKRYLKRGDVEDLIKAFDDIFGYDWPWDAYNQMRRGGRL